MLDIKQKEKIMETKLKVIDLSGDFIKYWSLAIKEQFPNTYCQFELNNIKSPLKTLTNMNITLIDESALKLEKEKEILFTINVLRVTNEKELKPEKIDRFKKNMKDDQISVLLMNISEGSENSIKKATKFMEKIMKDNYINNLQLIPYVYGSDMSGCVYNTISNFVNELKKKITDTLNNKLKICSKFLESAKSNKETFKNLDALLAYLGMKFEYINFLFLCDYWYEIQKTVEQDLFQNYRVISQNYTFREPFNLVQFNEEIIITKIKDKSISIIELQQYLVYNYLKSSKMVKGYTKMNDFITKINDEMTNFSSNFKSLFHFYFWYYLYLNNILEYYGNIKNSFNLQLESDYLIYQGRLKIYYYIKKLMKNYSNLSRISLPNEKIFKYALDYNNAKEISEELDKLLNSQSYIFENNEKFKEFAEDINKKNFDKKTVSIFTKQKIFIKNFLNILNSINDIHVECGHINLSIKVCVEMIPYYFEFSNFEQIKKILINLMKEKQKIQKWEYVYDYLNFILIILLKCLDKNSENLLLLLQTIDIKMIKINHLFKLVECNNNHFVDEIISNFINTFDNKEKPSSNSQEGNIAKFNLNKIINIYFNNKNTNKILYANVSESKNKELEIYIDNPTGFFFNVPEINLVFTKCEDNSCVKNNSKKDKTEENFIVKKDIRIEPMSTNKKETLSIDDISKLQINNIYMLKQIEFSMNNGIVGVYTTENNQTIELNVKCIDFNYISKTYPSYDTKNYISSLSNANPENNYYYNCLCCMTVDFESMPSNLNNKVLSFTIESYSNIQENKSLKVNNIKIVKFILENNFDTYKEDLNKKNIEILNNSIHFKNIDNLIFANKELNIPFIIENTNYSNSKITNYNIKLITELKELNEGEDKQIYHHTQDHIINIKHLFNISQKYTYLRMKDSILMQSTFSLNYQVIGLSMYSNFKNKSLINFDSNQSMNKVIIFPNNNDDIVKKLRENFIEFTLGNESNKYRLFYPEQFTQSEIKNFFNMPYYIEINVENKEHKIFEEFPVNVYIHKYIKEKESLMIKINENEFWSVIGKSKIYERFNEGNSEVNVQFKLFPLQDGFLEIPEIEFMEVNLVEKGPDSGMRHYSYDIHDSDYINIKKGTVIIGNKKIVKINSINNTTLKLSLN